MKRVICFCYSILSMMDKLLSAFIFMKWMSFLFCVATPLKSTAADEDYKLMFVQIIYRHGDRAPVTLYPNDPNPESVWTYGLGKLTMLGRKQHYNLGKYFRQFYAGFITSSPLEVNVTSGDDERCLKSAASNLASFYTPSEGWKFDEDVNWQPITIRYLPKKEDLYLQVEYDCPRATAESLRVENSQEMQEFNAKHKEMYDYYTKHSGSQIKSWIDASYLQNNLFVEMLYNLTIPDWVYPYWDELTDIQDQGYHLLLFSPLQHRLRGGPIIQKVIQTMQAKIEGKIPELKIQIYSAHDTNIAAFLIPINLYTMKELPYCATLLVELYSGRNGTHFVRFLYLNSTELSQTPYVLVLDGCTEYCPLNYFIDYTKHLMSDDWEKECQLTRSKLENFEVREVRLGVIFLAVIFVIVTVGFALAIWKIYSTRTTKQSLITIPSL